MRKIVNHFVYACLIRVGCWRKCLSFSPTDLIEDTSMLLLLKSFGLVPAHGHFTSSCLGEICQR